MAASHPPLCVRTRNDAASVRHNHACELNLTMFALEADAIAVDGRGFSRARRKRIRETGFGE